MPTYAPIDAELRLASMPQGSALLQLKLFTVAFDCYVSVMAPSPRPVDRSPRVPTPENSPPVIHSTTYNL